MLVATVVLFAIGILAATAAPFTFGISIVVYAFFCIYSMAAAVAGDRAGLAAIGESVEIAFRKPVTTLGLVAGVGLTAFAMGALATFVETVPFVGPLVAGVVVQLVVAYATLVIVGEYRALRGTGVPV